MVLDEVGDLEYNAFLELKELWNGTEGACGWYMIGADGLRKKIENGIANKKVGYREIFSRFGNNYSRATKEVEQERVQFYKELIESVLRGNGIPNNKIRTVVASCLKKIDGHIGGLRRAESILLLNQ